MSSSRSNTPPKSSASTRHRIARQKTADQQRHRQIRLAVTGIGLVVVILAALIMVKAAGGGGSGGMKQTASTTNQVNAQTTNAVIAKATGVPVADLDTAGSGGVTDPAVSIPNATALTGSGKPEIVYLGAEYCPYCAAERWPLVIALSRFGTFTSLGLTQSGSSDVYPSTNTFTFLNAKYTSRYLSFTSAELQDVNHNPLQTPTAAQKQLLDTYDVAPYTTSPGSIPFIDFGNRFIVSGASYNPQILQNQSWAAIAASLTDPSSTIGKSIDGAANQLTAAICKMTGGQPSNVCSTPAISSLTAGH
jgi:thiol-disulfide isomerase/thioredoxin